MTVQPCPLCDGAGCEECDRTGERHSSGFTTPSGATIMVHGSAPLSEKTRKALEVIADAAFARMDEDAA